MSWLGGDSPLLYDTSTLAAHFAIASDLAVDANDGHNGGPGLTGSSANGYGIQDVRKISDGQRFLVGGRHKCTSDPSSEKRIFGVVGTDRALRVIATRLTDGRIAVWRGDLEQLLGVTDAAVDCSATERLALSGVLASGVGGSFTLYLDDAVLLTKAGVDTGDAPWGGIYLGATTAMFWSHWYYADDLTVRPGIIAERKVSETSDLAETSHDGDASYEELSENESFADGIDSPTSRRVIHGVKTVAVVRHINEEDTGFRPEITIAGTVVTADRQPISTTYGAVNECYAVNPITGVPFTGTDITDPNFAIGGKAVA